MEQKPYKGIDTLANTWGSGISLNDYAMKMKYDENGNILKNLRNGTVTGTNLLAMDDLTYNYKPGTNQLTYIKDGVYASNYSEDIDDQDPYNYAYDVIGNLIKDQAEEIGEINWNVYGKVKSIKRKPGSTKPELTFSYSPDGNRISKTVTSPLGGGQEGATFYVRDAQSNIMAIYSLLNDSLFLDEHVIYGSTRLGVVKQDKVLWTKNTSGITNIGPAPAGISIAGTLAHPALVTFLQPKIKYNHVLGKKRYELVNHLGNVMVVISDKKIANDQNNDGIIDYYTADVKATYDYYAGGGQLLPGRNFNADQYRFKYQGQESDDEIYGVGNSYAFKYRMSNPRTGGDFWSVDPLFRDYPGWSPYAFSQRRYIDGTEMEGLEWEPLNEKGNPVAPGSENIADYRWVGWSKIQYATTENDMTKISDQPLSSKSVPFGAEAPAGTVPSAELQITDQTKVIYSSDPFKMAGLTQTFQTQTIRVNRYYEDAKQTISTFQVPMAGEFPISGNFIEPSGPSTAQRQQNKRIPAGTYDIYKHWRNPPKQMGEYGLKNNDVPSSRAILFHYGENYNWTEGCLVCPNRQTLEKLNTQIKSVSTENIRVIIMENNIHR